MLKSYCAIECQHSIKKMPNIILLGWYLSDFLDIVIWLRPQFQLKQIVFVGSLWFFLDHPLSPQWNRGFRALFRIADLNSFKKYYWKENAKETHSPRDWRGWTPGSSGSTAVWCSTHSSVFWSIFSVDQHGTLITLDSCVLHNSDFYYIQFPDEDSTNW